MKRFIKAVLISWMLFIGIDFIFHASIFASLWKENIAAFKTPETLFLLIPAGYFSFLLLTALIGYLFIRIFITKPPIGEVFKFAFIFGMLFSVSNFFGLFSYAAIPLKHLLIFNFGYFIEIIVVTLCFYFSVFSANFKKVVWISTLIFISLLISGFIIQNI